MNLLVPMNNSNIDIASITKIENVKSWFQLKIKNGKLVEYKSSNDNWQAFEEFSDIVVVCCDSEYVWPFIDMNMVVLVAHTQKSIEDIVEAYLFKELHELAY